MISGAVSCKRAGTRVAKERDQDGVQITSARVILGKLLKLNFPPHTFG